MDNHEIAAAFSEMADLLLIQGGDEFRIRAFNRTARIVEGLAEPLEALLARDGLRKIPGIGEGSVHRIKQILRSGSCDDLRRLRAQLPSGLRDMLDIKGVGPRTVRIVWQHLKLGTVAELEAAARAGRLQKLPRMGARTEEKILEGIAAWKQRAGRVSLQRALREGYRLRDALREVPGVVAAELGGSARRGKSTVGDLDILCATDDGGPVVARFVTLPGVSEVLWRGDGRCSVRLESRQQVDLRIIPPENFGAGMHYFTGSQLHNIAIRARAKRFGVEISEHGVFQRGDGTTHGPLITPGTREEEIFAAVGLPFIPPELRENTGEIEAAEQGRLPRLVEASDLIADLHLHTVESDGKGTLEQMVDAAIALGHSYLAVTDHSKALDVANGLDAKRVRKQGEAIRSLEQQRSRIRILRGLEVDILPDGELDLDPDTLRGLDWVVASVHSELDMPDPEMTRRLVRAIESGLVDCIGHPTGRMIGHRDASKWDVDIVLKAALRAGVAMEVNGNPKRMDLDDVHARRCRELGVPVAIDTDAHHPDHLSQRQFGLAAARRGWIEPKHVVNCWPVATLLERRRDRTRSDAMIGWTAPEPVAPPAAPQPSDDLREALSADPIDPELLARLERYLVSGDDEIDATLRTISTNPLAHAFVIVGRARK